MNSAAVVPIAHQHFDPGNEMRQGGGDNGRQHVSVIEALAGHRDIEGARAGIVKLLRQCQHGLRRKLVREATLGPGVAEFLAADFARGATFRGIDEDHCGGMANGLCQLGSKLVQAQDFYFGAGKLPFQRVGRAPGEPVVAAEGIAVGENEDAGHGGKCSPGRIRPGLRAGAQ